MVLNTTQSLTMALMIPAADDSNIARLRELRRQRRKAAAAQDYLV
jgi:hypothetical protein